MKSTHTLCAIVLTALAASSYGDTTNHINDAIGPGDNDSRWVVGATTFSQNSVYAGESDDTGLLPVFRYNGDRFFTQNGNFNFKLGQHERVTFGAKARYSSSLLADRSEYNSNPLLAGLNERDGSFEGGFYVNHTTDLGRFQFSVLSDLQGKHDGQTAQAQYSFDLNAAGWAINPTVGVSWMSDKKVNHLFGVSGSEATSDRHAYSAGPALNVFAGLRVRYSINDHWDFGAATGVTKWGSDVTNSSIVDDDLTYHGNLSLTYNF